jgi:hypothetical protein
MMKKIVCLLMLMFVLCSCNADNDTNSSDDNTQDSTNSNETNDFTITCLMPNAYSKSGQTITFTKAGEYTVSGSFDGSLVFDVNSGESVTLYLKNAKINSVDNHGICWKSENGKIEIKAVENTINEINVKAHSTNLYSAIESENNIEIGGSGKLSINGGQRHAVKGSNIEIKGNVDLTIEAVKDGLHGKQVLITGGNTKINNCTDAIQVDVNSNNLKGTVTVEEGILTINNCKRAFKATTSVTIQELAGCTIKINVNNTETLFETAKVNYVNGTFLVNGVSYK